MNFKLVFMACLGLCLSCGAEVLAKEKVSQLKSHEEAYFPLHNVRLLESPFKNLQNMGKEYLLWLNPDALLHYYRVEAGLPPKAEPYAGWESQDVWGGGPLQGAFLCFYLSSVSMMYESTGDEVLLERLKYVLNELKLCQQMGGDGYVMGIKDGKSKLLSVATGEITATQPLLNGTWAPVYLINKMLLGLSAAYTQCGLQEALPIMRGLAGWFGREVLDKLSEEQIQRMLVCEHGSIGESFVDMYELTNERQYLDWAYKLCDQSMWVPFSEGKDVLPGWHANTQIPKFTSCFRYYEASGDERFLKAATNFWNTVVHNYSWVIGGNSTGEHFFSKEEFEQRVLEKGGPETCNSVNMLRLTEKLFGLYPDAEKAAYYERVLFNHILSAYEPEKGMCCYYTSMRPDHYRLYATRDSSFWCCNHTGLESPAKLGRFIYTREKEGIRVNLFIPSVLSWKERGIELIQRNVLPESDEIEFKLRVDRKQSFPLYIRKPLWAINPELIVNGEKVIQMTEENGYWIVEREWNTVNTIRLRLPMEVYVEKLPGSDKYAALLYGPYVLAGRMGKTELPKSFWGTMNNVAEKALDLKRMPTFRVKVDKIPGLVKRISNAPLVFNVSAKGFENIPIEPFFRIHYERYSIYWLVK